ncbi:amino acid ABC transporter permease [Ruminococcaceae bacterium OttesenSCG-928-A16]|nr:amino acid ABC transporter permease [Ruminococcaceae bacterium OttesenSCG-928-A16]
MNNTFWGWVAEIWDKYWQLFLNGTAVTLYLAVAGTLIGLAIGLIIGVVRTIPLRQGGQTKPSLRSVLLRFVNFILSVYIEVFRGTPMMVQAVIIYYGMQEGFGLDIPRMTAGLIIISLNTGAYMSEVVRGGIHSVDKGQGEAAKAIGMTHWQTMRYVVMPQAIRNILPATGNEFVINIKDSSVLNVISVGELFFAAKSIQGIAYRYYETFLITAIIYLILTFTFTRLLRLLEKRMDGPDSFTLIASSTMPHPIRKQNGRTKM